MLSSHSASWRHRIHKLNTSSTCFTIRSRVLFKHWKHYFSPQRKLILLNSFPCNGHQQKICCLLVSKLSTSWNDFLRDRVRHLWYLTAVFQFYQISFLRFYPDFQERVYCIWSVQTPGSTFTMKYLLIEDVSDHLNSSYKTTYTVFEAEWKLCLRNGTW